MKRRPPDDPDLFDYSATRYPDDPGFKEKGGTSEKAAIDMSLRAGTLRWKVVEYLKNHPLHTADETAYALDESPLAIRPRFSELRLMGIITNEGRGMNASGKEAHKWKLVEHEATPDTR